MRKLEIAITKARLTSFSVSLDEDKPKVDATITLYTDGGKSITSYSISSEHWQDDKKFDLPLDLIPAITECRDVLERIVIEHCKSSTLRLNAEN